MARQPTKPKKGQPFRLNLVLDGSLVEQIDAFAEQLTKDDAYGRLATRTDAFRALIIEGLRASKSKH